jgi:hypothetical protein
MSTASKLRVIIVSIIVLALGTGALFWLIVPPPANLEPGSFYSPFGAPTTLVDATLAIGGGLLFLRALRNFKVELKPAWRLVAVAQMSLGVLTLLFPYVEYYDLWSNIWWNMSTYLPFLIGSVFMYLGIRRFYKILGLKSWVTRIWIVALIVLAAWGIHALVPHIVTWDQFNERQYDLFELIPTIPVICYGAAAFMAFRMRTKVGSDYNKSFGWLTIGLSLQLFATITIAVLEFVGYENWYFSSRAYEIPNIVGDIGILAAAYYFNAIGLQASAQGGARFWQRLKRSNIHEHVTSPAIVAYIARLSSDTSKIDLYLDKMRAITALQQPGEALSIEDQQALMQAYLHIEDYLVTAEPLRKFDKTSLRAEVAQHFALHIPQNVNDTFWPHLPQ